MAGIRTRSRTAKGKPQRYFLSKQQASKSIFWWNTNPQHFFHVSSRIHKYPYTMHLGGARHWESNLTLLKKTIYYIAISVSGRDEANPKLWLATRACKLEFISPARDYPLCPARKNFPESHMTDLLLTKPFSVKMTGYWPRSVFFFLRVYGPRHRFRR